MIYFWVVQQMSYNKFETEAKNILKKKYPNSLWYKLTNFHRIDFIGIGVLKKSNKKIVRLVEAKSTKKNKYYPFESTRKKQQLKAYLKELQKFQELGFLTKCYIIIKIKKNIKFFEFKKLTDIPKVIK
jgi:hypothetical protein